MKRLKCCFVSTGFLIPLFWGTMAIAQTDLLNLDSYKEGDIPSYGENIVVKQDEKTGIKWISRGVDTIGSGVQNNTKTRFCLYTVDNTRYKRKN